MNIDRSDAPFFGDNTANASGGAAADAMGGSLGAANTSSRDGADGAASLPPGQGLTVKVETSGGTFSCSVATLGELVGAVAKHMGEPPLEHIAIMLPYPQVLAGPSAATLTSLGLVDGAEVTARLRRRASRQRGRGVAGLHALRRGALGQ